MEWAEPDSEVPHTQFWLRSDTLPEAGQTRVVLIPKTLPQNSRQWLLFLPGLSSINGLEEHFSEVEQVCVAECDFDLLGAAPHDRRSAASWYKASIRQVFGLREFDRHVKPSTVDFYLYDYHTHNLVAHNDWLYLDLSTEGDLGIQLLFLKQLEQLTLVYMHEWCLGDYKAYITNTQLIQQQRNWAKHWIPQL